MGAMSRLSFMKPASKSGSSYGFGDLIIVEPRENGYYRTIRPSEFERYAKVVYLEEVEHGEEFARWEKHVVPEPAALGISSVSTHGRDRCSHPAMTE